MPKMWVCVLSREWRKPISSHAYKDLIVGVQSDILLHQERARTDEVY